MEKQQYPIPELPFSFDVETLRVLKKAIQANKAIAELKGIAQTLPNQALLINTLTIQESKDSSEVESIVTTHDELFRFEAASMNSFSPASKEVYRYKDALYYGYQSIEKLPISTNLLVEISKIITDRSSGLRNTMGTTLRDQHGKVIYTPPQNLSEIEDHMSNLEKFINDDTLSELDPLVKMAIIHHQFESVHPFFDGNGRTGRILNILYLIKSELLDIPVLYLSRYLTRNKADYYRLLQKVRDKEAWEEWILFMLDAIESTARHAIAMIDAIKRLISEYKTKLRTETKFYSHELINNLFKHPYTRIDYVMKDIGVSRVTATKYLNELVSIGLLDFKKIGKSNYYLNTRLVDLFLSMT